MVIYYDAHFLTLNVSEYHLFTLTNPISKVSRGRSLLPRGLYVVQEMGKRRLLNITVGDWTEVRIEVVKRKD